MKRVKGFLVLAAGLGLGLLLGALVYLGGPGAADLPGSDRRLPPTVGSPAGDFTLERLDGETVQLSDLQGKAVLVNFWATWCVPCRAEMPLIEQYAQQYGDQLVVLGVNYAESPRAVADFVAEVGITFPILLDRDGRTADSYFVRSYPATFFIDQQGIIRAQHLGVLTTEQMPVYLETVGVQE